MTCETSKNFPHKEQNKNEKPNRKANRKPNRKPNRNHESKPNHEHEKRNANQIRKDLAKGKWKAIYNARV
jgi:hypothetical protein